MNQHKLSARKRLTKPILFGTLIVGLATAFFNRHRFLEDLDDMKAEERAKNYARKMEILERRHKQIQDAEEKRRTGSG